MPTDGTDNLYKDIILDHYRNPRNARPLAEPDATCEGNNPLCGDQVVVQVKLRRGRVEDITVQSRGCSISRASGSIMTKAVKGTLVSETLALYRRFSDAVQGSGPRLSGAGDLEALQGVRKFPGRTQCALLPWTTLERALAAADKAVQRSGG